MASPLSQDDRLREQDCKISDPKLDSNGVRIVSLRWNEFRVKLKVGKA